MHNEPIGNLAEKNIFHGPTGRLEVFRLDQATADENAGVG
jgi:hypothetical protein